MSSGSSLSRLSSGISSGLSAGLGLYGLLASVVVVVRGVVLWKWYRRGGWYGRGRGRGVVVEVVVGSVVDVVDCVVVGGRSVVVGRGVVVVVVDVVVDDVVSASSGSFSSLKQPNRICIDDKHDNVFKKVYF